MRVSPAKNESAILPTNIKTGADLQRASDSSYHARTGALLQEAVRMNSNSRIHFADVVAKPAGIAHYAVAVQMMQTQYRRGGLRLKKECGIKLILLMEAWQNVQFSTGCFCNAQAYSLITAVDVPFALKARNQTCIQLRHDLMAENHPSPAPSHKRS